MIKIVKTRAYKDILKSHKAPIIGLFSPYGPSSGFLYSISTDGLIRGIFFYLIIMIIVFNYIINKSLELNGKKN